MIIQKLKTFSLKIGIDKATYWTLINKISIIIKGPVSLYFILKYLTPLEQGQWYTFGSLAALTILAELGFSTIITQFISHEVAHLQIENHRLVGNNNSIERTIGIARFSIRFYMLIVPIAIFILAIIGYFYFKNETIQVIIAWFIFSVVGGLTLFLVLMQSIYQGLDKVTPMQINVFLVTLAQSFFNWAMLIFGYGLWSLVIGNLIGLLIAGILLFITAIPFWKQIFYQPIKNKYNFLKETLPLQGKFAVSMISAYFTLYFIIPITYKYIGKVEAGQLGISISLINAVSGISLAWITTKVPKLNILVSKKKYDELDELFNKALKQGLIAFTLLSIIFFIFFKLFLSYVPSFATRFLPFNLLILLMLPQFIYVIINFYTFYLRAFKQEPLMWVWLLQSVFTILSAIIIMKIWGIKYFLLAQNLIYFLILYPITWLIYKKKSLSYKDGNHN